MTIRTNTQNRRELVRQIADLLQRETEYKGPPTFAYAVGPVTVDRDGVITYEDDETLEMLKPYLMAQGYIEPETSEEAEPDEEQDTDVNVELVAEPDGEPDMLEIAVPIDGMNGSQLRNLVYLLHGYQYLLNRVTRRESVYVSDVVITILAEQCPESAADFVSLMNNNKAADELRGVDFRADAVALNFPLDESPEKNKAYADLTCAMVKAARTAKRVDAQARRPENEKYELRSWLVRLGLGGADYKATRNALLRGLKGHTAFRTEADAERHKAKYAELRRLAREARGGAAE